MQGKPEERAFESVNKVGTAIETIVAEFDAVQGRLEAYEAALREIASFEGLLTQDMAHNAINIARKALGDA